ncbi:type I phosphomannose isomerase catalytic subunit [Altibacter lentus]|uniref:type I phosphomannose isomerase catalytic subunit n=1 Tax=Altibacter lentus TaxID=1223410 RepID=UPI000A9E5BBA|nr:type I phosphomannose isomerase catalytic subunit [Altibacter lentus]
MKHQETSLFTMGSGAALYPLKFTPILKEKVWGGGKLKTLFRKEKDGNIGESWELSGVKDSVSHIRNGSQKGNSLLDLIKEHKSNLVGEKVYDHFGDQFPLLFKFIDAKQDLSVQLHPDDDLAKSRHNSFGKTEMWYILHSEPDARLILGFNEAMDVEKYQKALSENTITSILHSEKVHEGDAFFIPPGTVHAIGAGVVLAEIQQTSDVTYRIYDWDRPDTDGTYRELHTDLAVDAINFEPHTTKISYSEEKNTPVLLKRVPYFETNKLDLSGTMERDLSGIDSFTVYMCVKGSAIFKMGAHTETVETGETILIPAVATNLTIVTDKAIFLEVYIP